MDFVKREDSNLIEEENYKVYMDAVQKYEMTDYQHTAITMEQLHQAMQSSLNATSIVHNLQLPISPRQMSTLMYKSNITRSLNFETPHLQRTDMELVQSLPNDLTQNIRHEDLINQNLVRNLDVNLARTIANDLELQSTLPNSLQSLNEQDLNRNLANEGLNLNRINDVALQQSIIRTENNISHSISNEMALAHMNRHLDQQLIIDEEESRTTPVQCVSENLIEHQMNPRLDQHLVQRLEHSSQRLDQILAHRMASNVQALQRPLETNDMMHFHIKAEQDDEGYFYDNMNQGIPSSNDINGHIALQPDHPQPNLNQDHVYCVYNNQITPVAALNQIDMYTKQSYVQNYVSNIRENPQNLVVNKQFEYQNEEFKKLRQEPKHDPKNEEPKENLKPFDPNKMYYDFQNDIPKSADKDSKGKEAALSVRGLHACYKCNDVFSSKRAMKQHSKICDKEDGVAEKQGKFACSQCAYSCQSPAILKIHERTHSGEKPYACTFCDYKSGQKNNVTKHVLVHMKEKPFKCQYCEYRCAQKNNLVVHERTHTGYKPFGCPYCDYRTVQKPNLVKHMYLHTDQKPFSCDICNYRCVQKTNLTKHKLRHVNEKRKLDDKTQKPYRPRQKSVKCPHCTYRCVQKSSLEKHIQFKHADVQDFVQLDQGLDQGLDLGVKDDSVCVQNLSVKKDQCVQEKILEMQS